MHEFHAARVAPLVTLLLAACATPQQYDPMDAQGPAVATNPREMDGARTTPADASAPTSDVRDIAETDTALAQDVSVDGSASHDVAAPDGAGLMDTTVDRAPDLPPDLPSEPPPIVVRIPEASAPARLPAGTKVSCLSGPNILTHADCPVLRWREHSYWTLSYLDNRIAATVVAYDSTGRIVKEWVHDNVRYIWNVEVDQARREVVFHFQDSRMVAMSWDDLRVP